MEDSRGIQLPLDLIGTIAANVAQPSRGRSGDQRQALLNCMLVCRTFAQEFRPHLFNRLTISEGDEKVAWRLCIQIQILEDHPEYVPLVKAVTIELALEYSWMTSILEHRQFSLALSHLTSVTSFYLHNYGVSFSLARLKPHPHNLNAIIKICSLPSIRSLYFGEIEELPSSFFCNAPNLEYLGLSNALNVDPQDSNASLQGGLASHKPQLHLNIIRHERKSRIDVTRTTQGFAPILRRVTKLSAPYTYCDQIEFVKTVLRGGSLRELVLRSVRIGESLS
jgi:hypothetical protein